MIRTNSLWKRTTEIVMVFFFITLTVNIGEKLTLGGFNLFYTLFFIVFFIVFFIYIFYALSFNTLKIPYLQLIDYIPLLFVVIWFYGLVLGLVLGNEQEYVTRNFAGMLLFLSYYLVLFSRVSKETIFRLGYSAAIINVLITVFLSLRVDFNISIFSEESIFGRIIGGSSTGQPRIYYIGQISIFILLSVTLFRFANPSKFLFIPYTYHIINKFFCVRYNFIALIFLVTSTYCLAFITASKGFMLGVLFLFGLMMVGFFYKSLISMRLSKGVIFIVTFTVLLLITLYLTGYSNIISSIFSKNDIANEKRYEQFDYLIDDIKFFGNGLGAVIPGYKRNSLLPYGFELSHINIFHKFGIFAIFLIFGQIFILVKGIINLNKSEFDIRYTSCAIGAMCFVFPSIGNPIIFAPQSVLLYCIALFLLRK